MTIGELTLGFGWPVWLLRAVVVWFGLIWGSFLNVVIYRLPLGMSVVRPPSHCPSCGAPVRPYDNVPILSYVILRGRARCCGAKMSARYPIVEAIGGALSIAIFEVLVQTLAPETTLARAAAIYFADFALSLSLVAAAFIDAEHMFLPDSITLGGTVLGIGTASLRAMTYPQAILGAALGFGGVFLPFIVLYKLLRGRPGMGVGDAKLTMLAGAWFGWSGALFVFFAGAFQGTIAAIIIYLVKGKIEEPEQVRADRAELEKAASEGDEEAKRALAEDPLGAAPGEGLMAARLSFGPFLILACLEFLFLGEWIRTSYFAWGSAP